MFSYCEVMFCAKLGSQIGNEYHFFSTCGHKIRSELTDSVPWQLQDSICEKGIIWNCFQALYRYEVIVMFLRLYHKINISKRMLEPRLTHYGFRRRGFSNVTINELKNAIESEIQEPVWMRGYRWLWHSFKASYGIIVQRDVVMNILKEIDPEGTNIWKAFTYAEESTYLKDQIPIGTLMATINWRHATAPSMTVLTSIPDKYFGSKWKN